MLARRAFLAGIAGLVAAPRAVVARPPTAGKTWRIEDVFFKQLRDLGYIEGRNLVVDRRYSEGLAERFADFATEFVRSNVDLIIVTTTPAVIAAKKATTTIPIVQPNSIDPVGAGLVASLARPGGNFTGTTQQAPDTGAKRLQLLVDAIPRVSTVAVVWNAANPANVRSFREVEDAGRTLHIKIQSRAVRSPADFERVLADMVRERPDAPDPTSSRPLV